MTTNGHYAPSHQLDYHAIFADLDFVSMDVYAGPADLARYVFECAWMRPMKGRPFWFMETASSHAAALQVEPGNAFDFAAGSLRAKMWLTYAMGGDAIAFWLWRAHSAGQEMEHGSLVYAWGDPTVNAGEATAVAAELAEHGDWLRATRPAPVNCALHYSGAPPLDL